MGNFLLDVGDINHIYIVVENCDETHKEKIEIRIKHNKRDVGQRKHRIAAVFAGVNYIFLHVTVCKAAE